MSINSINGTNVVSMMPRRAEMIFPALKDVEAYWEGLRNGRPIPSRGDIDPRGMQSALEYAFILERIAPGVARFRLAGMHLTDLMGMEVRGMPLTAMFTPEARTQISAALEAVCETPNVTTITLKSSGGMGRPALEAQLLLCPLKSDLGDVNRVLGCLQSKGDIGRQPRRFDVVEVTTRDLLTDMPATVQTPAAKTPATEIPGFVEAHRPRETEIRETPKSAPKATVPFLKLVSNNDA
ncbi:PAS domain-containing protein [Celeribacter marinus]|uniref:PAS domain-containing protein n=1 Tax=Celeribacter marinus TaxID=1397108 RepID=UPI003F6D7753